MTPADRAAFLRDGYLAIPDFLDAEAFARMRAERVDLDGRFVADR